MFFRWLMELEEQDKVLVIKKMAEALYLLVKKEVQEDRGRQLSTERH